jgi:hypothetical protein
MKMRQLVVATSAALVSLGAIAGGQQRSENTERTAPQAATETSVIREAQDALRAKGHAATPQGLREFQQAQGIEPSGRLDEQTLAALGVGVSASSGASSESAAQPAETSKN